MARTLYAMKPTDPGQEITVDGTTYTIWSAGPQPSSVWAFDAEGRWAVVRLRKGQPAGIVVADPESSPNVVLHFALRLLRADDRTFYHEITGSYDVSYWEGPGAKRLTRRLHCDPACSHVSSSEREPVDTVTRRLLADAIQSGRPASGICECVHRELAVAGA